MEVLPGQKAVENNLLPLFEKGKQASIKNVILPLDGCKTSKDITDYFVSAGGTSLDLQALIEETPEHDYSKKVNYEVAIDLDSFAQVESNKYIDKKVSVGITVCGETSEAYHVPVFPQSRLADREKYRPQKQSNLLYPWKFYRVKRL